MGADGEDEKKVSFALYLSQDNVFSLIWCAILFSKCFFTLRSMNLVRSLFCMLHSNKSKLHNHARRYDKVVNLLLFSFLGDIFY
jgi:hypothetical protein